MRVAFLPGGRLGRWTITAPTPSGALTLALVPESAYVLHGHHGVIQQGPGGLSAYYSAPRLRATGVLTLAGHRSAVRGLGWLDHQWGNFATDPAARSATSYPLGSRLDVPAVGIHLTLHARARDQYIHNTFVASFWEGAAEVVAGPAGGCIVESSREVVAAPR